MKILQCICRNSDTESSECINKIEDQSSEQTNEWVANHMGIFSVTSDEQIEIFSVTSNEQDHSQSIRRTSSLHAGNSKKVSLRKRSVTQINQLSAIGNGAKLSSERKLPSERKLSSESIYRPRYKTLLMIKKHDIKCMSISSMIERSGEGWQHEERLPEDHISISFRYEFVKSYSNEERRLFLQNMRLRRNGIIINQSHDDDLSTFLLDYIRRKNLSY